MKGFMRVTTDLQVATTWWTTNERSSGATPIGGMSRDCGLMSRWPKVAVALCHTDLQVSDMLNFKYELNF